MGNNKDIWEMHEEAIAEFREKLRKSQYGEGRERENQKRGDGWGKSVWYKLLQIVGAIMGALIILALFLLWW